LGADAGGETVRAALRAAGVRVVDLGLSGPTPEKVRIRVQGTSIARLDHGGAIGRVGSGAALDDAVEAVNAILVADYGRGVAAQADVRRVVSARTSATPVVWDPHPRGAPPVPGVQLVTPNESELMGAGRSGPAGLAALDAAARALRTRAQAQAVAVTIGARGALLTNGDGPPLVVPCPPVFARDTCGAGDCFASTAATHLAAGRLVSEAVEAAVADASAFVARGGVATLRQVGAVTRNVASATELIAHVRARNGTIVVTGGCFDLLHAGHVALLEAARRLGDCLIVLLNSDRSVRELKGADRPLQPAPDRAAVLRALSCVDAVEEFDTARPIPALQRIRPDVFVKGGDYAGDDIPEAQAVRAWGGQFVTVPYVAGRSTTRMIEEVLARGG
jgi:D-beta-D-heptose 7-phosphate kinase/D-beta-D-heptose 1-phosphate adenosyltransferase